MIQTGVRPVAPARGAATKITSAFNGNAALKADQWEEF